MYATIDSTAKKNIDEGEARDDRCERPRGALRAGAIALRANVIVASDAHENRASGSTTALETKMRAACTRQRAVDRRVDVRHLRGRRRSSMIVMRLPPRRNMRIGYASAPPTLLRRCACFSMKSERLEDGLERARDLARGDHVRVNRREDVRGRRAPSRAPYLRSSDRARARASSASRCFDLLDERGRDSTSGMPAPTSVGELPREHRDVAHRHAIEDRRC